MKNIVKNCMFRIALVKLGDCYEDWQRDLSDDENEARNKIYELCLKISERCKVK